MAVNFNKSAYCKMCHKPIFKNSPRQLYCADCKHKANLSQQRYYNATKRLKNKPQVTQDNDKAISEINKRAHALGISYGKYLVKYGEKGENNDR